MATPLNAQFTIPEGIIEQQNTAALLESAPTPESQLITPEAQRSPFQVVKDIENHAFALRSQALGQTAPKATWLQAAKLRRPQQITPQELINKESFCGGKIVSRNENDRFWLDAKSACYDQQQVADWYFAKYIPETNGHQVIRFQTTPFSIHKLYEGREVALSEEERVAFLETTAAYPGAIEAVYNEFRLAA